jgi:hypothetical protein
MTLQQLKNEVEKLKESINPKTSQPDILKIKEELKAKLNQMRERMQERGELPELTAQEIEEIKETVLKSIRERAEELKKDPYWVFLHIPPKRYSKT